MIEDLLYYASLKDVAVAAKRIRHREKGITADQLYCKWVEILHEQLRKNMRANMRALRAARERGPRIHVNRAAATSLTSPPSLVFSPTSLSSPPSYVSLPTIPSPLRVAQAQASSPRKTESVTLPPVPPAVPPTSDIDTAPQPVPAPLYVVGTLFIGSALTISDAPIEDAMML